MSIVSSRGWNRSPDHTGRPGRTGHDAESAEGAERRAQFPSRAIGATEAFVRVHADRPACSDDRFVNRFLALMLSGVTDELVGEIVAVGSSLSTFELGDRVVVPATVSRARVHDPTATHGRILRVPCADRTLMKIPEDLRHAPDEDILFLYRSRLDWLDLE